MREIFRVPLVDLDFTEDAQALMEVMRYSVRLGIQELLMQLRSMPNQYQRLILTWKAGKMTVVEAIAMPIPAFLIVTIHDVVD
jgi:hypothetical protein